MDLGSAAREGARRALGAWRLCLGLWLANAIAALPFAFAVGAALHGSFGPGLAAERMRAGFDMGWYGTFQSRASGLPATFRPELLRAGAFLENLEGWLTGRLFEADPALLALGGAYALVWLLLLGGSLARLARGPAGASGARFFQDGARFFWRLLRLALVGAAGYWALYRAWLWSQDRLASWARDVASERAVLAAQLGAAMLMALSLVFWHAALLVAKVTLVREDRRSALLGLLRGLLFALRRPVVLLGLYGTFAALGWLFVALYAYATPGAGAATGRQVALAIALAQLCLLLKLATRLAWMGGVVALHEAWTPHAGDAS